MTSKAKISTCILRPSYGIRVDMVGDVPVFVAEHSDPQFELCTSDETPLTLRPAHYEFTFTGVADSGSLVAPCVYIDYGEGYGEGEGKHLYLTWKGDQVWAGSLMLTGKAKRIRFDPSIDVFEASQMTMTVRRMTGARTMLYSLARRGFRTLVP